MGGSKGRKKAAALNQNATTSSSPQVNVEDVEKGFLVSVNWENNCPGLLVWILEAFEELGLDVLDARVSCSATFQLEALGENKGLADNDMDGQVVKQAVLQAIEKWSESNGHI